MCYVYKEAFLCYNANVAQTQIISREVKRRTGSFRRCIMKTFDIEDYLKKQGVLSYAQQVQLFQIMDEPDVKAMLEQVHSELVGLKEVWYKTYDKLPKSRVDYYVDTVTVEVLKGMSMADICVDARARRYTRPEEIKSMDLKEIFESRSAKWVTFFVIKLQDENLTAGGGMTVVSG